MERLDLYGKRKAEGCYSPPSIDIDKGTSYPLRKYPRLRISNKDIDCTSLSSLPSENKMSENMCAWKSKWQPADISCMKNSDIEVPSASNQPCGEDSRVFLRNCTSNVIREKVKGALDEFRRLFLKLLRQYEAERNDHTYPERGARSDAAIFLRNQYKWVNMSKRLGPVPGIEVGDGFQCRAELTIIGLHCQFQNGIDYMKKGNMDLATSIVASGRYANDKSNDSLIYIGQGGNPRVRNVKPTDQKLTRGNLALKNSMEAKTPVRVILKTFGNHNGIGFWTGSKSDFAFVYDGLYLVEKMSQVRGEFGKLVFKFFLKRQPGQSESLTFRGASNSKSNVVQKDVTVWKRNISNTSLTFRGASNSKSNVVQKDVTVWKRNISNTSKVQKKVVLVEDISQGQEKFPIRVVISGNDVQKLPIFGYIVSRIYPECFKIKDPTPRGCDCIAGCLDCETCACTIKNGGIKPYDHNKKLTAHTIPLIYECGFSCKCSYSCINRVSQCGIQFQLEIFRTDSKGWGVRTRSYIPSGSFVCEYIGDVYLGNGATRRIDVDDFFFEIGVGKGLIDATHHGNIGRLINHSCSPNLFVKDVMYDHNDRRLPHKMLFALNDIPAGRELSYDYNCRKGKSCKGIFKFRGNSCRCGSTQCTGRIYN